MKNRVISIPRSSEGLREMLFVELELFRGGETSIKHAQTVVNLTREIISLERTGIVRQALLESLKKDAKKNQRALAKN